MMGGPVRVGQVRQELAPLIAMICALPSNTASDVLRVLHARLHAPPPASARRIQELGLLRHLLEEASPRRRRHSTCQERSMTSGADAIHPQVPHLFLSNRRSVHGVARARQRPDFSPTGAFWIESHGSDRRGLGLATHSRRRARASDGAHASCDAFPLRASTTDGFSTVALVRVAWALHPERSYP